MRGGKKERRREPEKEKGLKKRTREGEKENNQENYVTKVHTNRSEKRREENRK